jgi:hypothetical protein
VLLAKARRDLFTRPLLPVKDALAELERADRSVVKEIADRAITIVKNDAAVLPIGAGKKVAVASTEPLFADVLHQKLDARVLYLPIAPTRERTEADASKLIALAQDADVVVIAIESLDHRALVDRVKAALPKARIVVVSFSSPYLLTRLPSVDAYVCAFGWRDESTRAAALSLTNLTLATGKLPVTVRTSTKAAAAP